MDLEPHMLNPDAVEFTWLVLLIPVCGWAWIARKLPRRPCSVERAFSRLAGRRRLAVVSVGVLALAIRAALLPLHPVPQPGVMDEYSYLFAADTFASGRLTNPTHPFWVNLETFHILSQPTMASKYPPAQGLVLAAGIVLARNPWLGVWLSIGVMCSAIVWMLQAWLPPRWALLGGLLALVRIAIGSYWIDSYWGGAVAATGGALLYGALPRVMRAARARDGLILGLGVAILANSRPFEGCLLSLPAAVALMIWAFRRGWTALRPLSPVVVILAVTALGMMTYNYRITGSPFVFPEQVYESQYAVAPLFWFQQLRPAPVYRHAVMKAFWLGWACSAYLANHSDGLIVASLIKLNNVRFFYLGALLSVPLFALPRAVRIRKFRLPLLALGVMLAGGLAEVAVVPHYAAPATALIYLLIIVCLRCVRAKRPLGLAVARAIPVLLVCTVLVFYSVEAAGARFFLDGYSWCFTHPGNLVRAGIVEQLNRRDGKHLVLVRYLKGHELHEEWVYNRADVDAAKIVWAREMDPDRNRALIHYFKDRQVWLLEPDREPRALQPFPEQVGTPPALPAEPARGYR